MANSRFYFQIALYHIKPDFDSLGSFLDYLEPTISSGEFSKKSCTEVLFKLQDELALENDSKAILVSSTLSKLLPVIENLNEEQMLKEIDFESCCNKALLKYHRLFIENGIDFTLPSLDRKSVV